MLAKEFKQRWVIGNLATGAHILDAKFGLDYDFGKHMDGILNDVNR